MTNTTLEVCVVDVDLKVFKELINDYGGIDDYYEYRVKMKN